MTTEKHRLPIRLTLPPGQKGTKKLTQTYGDSLICVRYRYDEAAKKRYTTVEIQVATSDWVPAAKPVSPIPAPADRMGIRIHFEETELRSRVKQIGGIWRPRQRLWELTYAQVCALGLEDRIVSGD